MNRICTRCVSDTTIPDITFDERGVCNYCKIHERLDQKYPLDQKPDTILSRIKDESRKKRYDCIVGVSGGTDSTFCLYLAKKYGLKPLAVHFDNGWNSEVAVQNIRSAVETLGVDLENISLDFEEFRDLQRSFLMASVPDAEIPTDVAIHAVLHKVAAEYGIRWIINGMNFRTEGIQPLQWSYMDGKYIKAVQERFGRLPLNTYPNLTIGDMVRYTLVQGIRTIPILAYMDYSKKEAQAILARELGWIDYGGHHFESLYTRFIITDLLWQKFGIDKRKISLSAAVRSGKMDRDEAQNIIDRDPQPDEQITIAVLEKLGLSEENFSEILSLPPRTFHDYPTHYSLLRSLKIPIKWACSLNIVPEIFYLKYFGSLDT